MKKLIILIEAFLRGLFISSKGGHGSSHKGGHYKNGRTQDRYKKRH